MDLRRSKRIYAAGTSDDYILVSNHYGITIFIIVQEEQKFEQYQTL
jgi:hypothetical protein